MFQDEPWYQCPAAVWREDGYDLGYLLDMHAHYSNGFLPQSGAILDQVAKLMDALTIVGDEQALCSEEQKQEQTSKRALEQHQREVIERGRATPLQVTSNG